jgi:cysteine desulfurase/selenocysteine lyase
MTNPVHSPISSALLASLYSLAAVAGHSVLSFVLDGVRTEELSDLLNREGIALRSGHHCAQPIPRRFGLDSTIRASLALYNTYADIDALVAALLRIQAGRVHRV